MMARIFALLLVLSVPALAQAQEPAQEPPPQAADTDRERTAEPTPAWPPPFQPSEDIGADSPVSFPTDI